MRTQKPYLFIRHKEAKPANNPYRFFPILALVMLLSLGLAGCSSTDTPAYAPTGNLDLEAMAAEFPMQFEQWEGSVHGQAYLSGDENAPACLDCHTNPDSGEIQTAAFQLDIPNRCARCHADSGLMRQYDISSDVYATYLADYHGTTIAYYQSTQPDTYRYEAVCSDCHGSHAVYPPEDESSSVFPASLTATCQKCHHAAPENFSTAFGHYRPARTPVSAAESPVLFWVKLFYQALIPVTLGGMLAYIGLDIRHRANNKNSKE